MSSGLYEPTDLFEEFADVVDDDEAPIDESTTKEGEAVAVKYDFSNAELGKTPEEVEEEIREMIAAASEGSASFEMPESDYEWN